MCERFAQVNRHEETRQRVKCCTNTAFQQSFAHLLPRPLMDGFYVHSLSPTASVERAPAAPATVFQVFILAPLEVVANHVRPALGAEDVAAQECRVYATVWPARSPASDIQLARFKKFLGDDRRADAIRQEYSFRFGLRHIAPPLIALCLTADFLTHV